MGMELLIAVIAVAVVAILWAIRKDMTIGSNPDEDKAAKEDFAKEVRDWANEATATMKEVADVNKDGKVDVEDAKEAVEKVVAVAKKKVAKPRKPKTETAAKAKPAAATKKAAPKKKVAPKKKAAPVKK